MIADVGQMSYIHSFMPFLPIISRSRFAPGLAPERQSESKENVVLTHRKIYTEKVLHQLLHREAFTQSRFYKTLLHADAFTYRSFYTEKPFSKKP